LTVIGLFPHLKKENTYQTSFRLIDLLADGGYQVIMVDKDAEMLGRPELGKSEELVRTGIQFGVILGGDGALLHAARFLYPQMTPLFGINLGHLGFLTEFESGQMDDVVHQLVEGHYFLEDRMMVQAEVIRRDQVIHTLVGLNDIVVSKGSFSRMLRLQMSIDGQFVAEYPADGLIIATPTGSTAYSLSAGGPILDPKISALIITPICAHSMVALPLVVGGSAQIQVGFASASGDAMLTSDGQVGFELLSGDEIRFGAAPYPTRLVRFRERSFFQILRERVKAGKL
jgi:NAD+ kinase